MRDALQGRGQGNSLLMQMEEVAERSQEQHEYAIAKQSHIAYHKCQNLSGCKNNFQCDGRCCCRKELQQMAETAAQVVDRFEKEWEPVMEAVREAAETFENLEGRRRVLAVVRLVGSWSAAPLRYHVHHAGLMDGPQGFDSSRSIWRDAGWREVRELRKMLENLKELTALVRSLGRSSGKGALKRAPEQVPADLGIGCSAMHKDQSLLAFSAATLFITSCKTDGKIVPNWVAVQIWSSKGMPGVHRSPLQPEETRGLTRSGDISRMLPFEVHLLAASSAAVSGPIDAAGMSISQTLKESTQCFPLVTCTEV